MNTKKQYQINYLSADFYSDYDSKNYPEIENKNNRPYMVMLIQIENNTFALPFRTHITHKHSYRFLNTSRITGDVLPPPKGSGLLAS